MVSKDNNTEFVVLGEEEQVNHVYEWLDSDETNERINRAILETLAEIKMWQYHQNPRIPLRQILLNRNLYYSLCNPMYL